MFIYLKTQHVVIIATIQIKPVNPNYEIKGAQTISCARSMSRSETFQNSSLF